MLNHSWSIILLNNLDKLFTTDSWFWYTFNNMDYFIRALIFCYIVNYIYIRKSNKKIIFISFLVFYRLLFHIRFSPLHGYSIILYPALSYIYCKINYNTDNNKNILLISIIYWNLLVWLVEHMSFKIIYSLSRDNFNSYIYYIQLHLSMMIMLIMIFLGVKYYINMKKYKNKNLRLIFIPISVNLVSLLIVFDNVRRNIDSENMSELLDSKNFTMIIVGILLIISSVYISYVFDKMVKAHNMELENNIIKENINKDYNHYLSLKEQQIKTRQMHHDMKNHVICIKELYKSDDDSLALYIDKIDKIVMDYKENFETNNSILDIIINDKYNTCLSQDIDFKCNLDFSRCEFIDMIDVCTIFSNAIDNCIEGCNKVQDKSIVKYIDIKSTYINNMCVIKIENSSTNNIIIRNNVLQTDKKDKFLHGLGSKNIKDSVLKYSGQVNFKNENNKFIVKIIIPLKD